MNTTIKNDIKNNFDAWKNRLESDLLGDNYKNKMEKRIIENDEKGREEKALKADERLGDLFNFKVEEGN